VHVFDGRQRRLDKRGDYGVIQSDSFAESAETVDKLFASFSLQAGETKNPHVIGHLSPDGVLCRKNTKVEVTILIFVEGTKDLLVDTNAFPVTQTASNKLGLRVPYPIFENPVVTPSLSLKQIHSGAHDATAGPGGASKIYNKKKRSYVTPETK
jgi:hypothetical protein